MKLVLHPHTKRHVAQFVANPSHAVLLVGSNGIGKMSLAQAVVAEALGLECKKLATHPYFTVVRSDKDSISIDAIRELQRFLQLKTLGSGKLRRAVIIEHAERLTIEAQNALLKLLEEPPEDTLLVLGADNQRGLLPTILSRTQLITAYAPAEAELKQYFAELGKDTTAINQAYLLSGGLPGLMYALLENDQSHPLMLGVTAAKEVLQKSTFERLAMVETLSKQKEDTKYMLEALQHIAQTMLDNAAGKADQAKVKQWFHILRTAATAREALGNNANAKLVLDNVMLRI
jgi:DNA polymerase-3 subunit delta'